MEIKISQDIRKYKTKDIGKFSFQEAAYIAAGFGAGFLTYKFTKSLEVAMIPTIIIFVFGFFKPYGLTFMQFIRTVVKESLMPQCFINETDFEYDLSEFKSLYGNDVVIPAENDVIQTNVPAKINRKDRARILF